MSAAACSRRCTACGYPTTRRRRRTRGSEYSECSEYSLRTHRIDDGPTRFDRHWAAGTKSAGGWSTVAAGEPRQQPAWTACCSSYRLRQSTSNRQQIGRAFFRACRWARACPRAPPLGKGAHLRPNWGSGGRRRGASDKQHGQSARHGECPSAASWTAVDRVRSSAVKLGAGAPGAREEAGAAGGLGLSAGCLPSCNWAPAQTWPLWLSRHGQKPVPGCAFPSWLPLGCGLGTALGSLTPRIARRPAGRGWYVRRGPQGRVLRHPAGPGAVRRMALCRLPVRVRSRTLNPDLQLSLPRAQARPMAATTKAANPGQAGPCCSYTIHMPKMTQVQ